MSEDDIIDCFYNGITDPGIYRDFGRNRLKTVAGLRDMMHNLSKQEEKMREWFPRRQDSNLKRQNDNRNDKGQRNFSGPRRKRRLDDLITAMDHPREAGSRRRRRSSRSSCRRSAHGIQDPITRLSTVTISGGHSATLEVARRTRNRQTRNARMTTKKTKAAT
jgi:hypothetical protein